MVVTGFGRATTQAARARHGAQSGWLRPVAVAAQPLLTPTCGRLSLTRRRHADPQPLRRVQTDTYSLRLRSEPALLPQQPAHALQQPTSHVLQAAEQLPNRSAQLLRPPPQQAAPFQQLH